MGQIDRSRRRRGCAGALRHKICTASLDNAPLIDGFVSEVELDDGTRVARKHFDPDPAIIAALGLDTLKARFKREVKIQGQLSRDFFIPVLSSDLDSHPPSFTMPLAAKNYTEQIMEDHRSGHPSVGPLADILNGLEELHRLDYRHRDLKPQNILFYNGMWRLADFGLALPPADATTTLTRTHEIFGTEQYMSPEQATAFHTVLPATDIYAFGCILHDLVGVSPRLYFPRLTSLSCRQGKQPLGDGPNFLLGDPGA